MSELEVFEQANWVEPQNRFVFWSGGKDSTVALHLALRAWDSNPPQVVFIDTGITIPETLEYIERLKEEWKLNLAVIRPQDVRPNFDFWNYVAENGFPIITALWCRRILKMEPIKHFMKRHRGWKVQVLGIRKVESNVRKKAWYYERVFMRHRKIPFTYNLLPILNWTDIKIVEYIGKFQIPLNQGYERYGHTNCYFCPFIQNAVPYLNLKRFHPKLFQKIVQAEINRRGKTAWPRKSIIPILEQEFLEASN